MTRWIKRIILAGLLTGILAVLVWSMWPKPVPVEVTVIARGALEVTVDDDGRARVEDRYLVTAPLAGTLARIELRAGDAAAAGAVLARLAPTPAPMLDARSRTELAGRVEVARARQRQAQAAAARARTASDFAERDVDRVRSLALGDAVAGVELERAELAAEMAARDLESARFAASVADHELATANAMLARLSRGGARSDDDVIVVAPVAGQILRVLAASEGVVAPGTPILELGDRRNLEIVADVLTADAVAIRPGARVVIDGWGGPPLAGKVRRVEPSATTRVSALGVEEQRVAVIVDLAEPPARWEGLGDGWRVEVHIATWSSADVVTVPLGALFREGDAWQVYVIAGGRAHRRAVEVDHRSGVAAEVIRGLRPGDRVIMHPGERVRDGVRVVPR